MQVKELKKDATNFHLRVIIPNKNNEINTAIEKKLTILQKDLKMQGFRPGKVPLSIVRNKYFESVKNEVLQDQIQNAIEKIVTGNKLDLASPPKIEDLKSELDQDIEFNIKFEHIPAIKIPDLKSISIEKPVLKISDKEVDGELSNLAKMATKYDKEKEGGAGLGDRVTLDAIGTVEGVEFKGGKINNYKLVLGSKSFIDNFEDQLIGAKVGDEVLVKVNFPEHYHMKDVAGKPAEFKVNIIGIHEGTTPNIDDEFAKQFKVESAAELKNNIKDYMQKSYDGQIHTIMKMHLFDQLEKILDFEVPASLLEKEYNILKSKAAEFKEEDENLKDKTEKELEEYFKNLAMRRVRIGLMLSEYGKNKELKITENDLKAAIFAEARNFPGRESEVVNFYMKNRDALEQIKGLVIEEKAVKHIFANEITIIEKEYDKKALEKLIESQE